MIFETGKLYKCSSHYIMIFPKKEDAIRIERKSRLNFRQNEKKPVGVAVLSCKVQPATASWWSIWFLRKHNCKVHLSLPNELFMVLKEPKISGRFQYINILCGEKTGWIVTHTNWDMTFEKVSQ